jgi:5'-nucleotidase
VRRIVAVVCVLGLTAGLGLAPAGAQAKPGKAKVQHLQVLAINDFHGNLEPPTGSGGRIPTSPTTTQDVGGAAYLGTWLDRLRQGHRHTLTVGAGDLIGASPLISGLFHDEPTIEALNAMGFKYSAVGNHEFDEGIGELLRMQNGGCHPTDTEGSCQGEDPFTGAAFQYLAANVRYAGTGKTVLPPYEVYKAGRGMRVGFIGLTLRGTPDIVTPAGVAGLQFDDEVQTVNRYADQLKARGVNAVFVLLHEGGQQNPPYTNGYQDVNGCDHLSGAVVPIVQGLSDAVDVVASAHTHQAYNCRIDGKVVTSAASFGRLITDFDLLIDRRTRDVVGATAENVPVSRSVPKDPAVQRIIDHYAALSGPIANRVVGSVTADITRDPSPAGESALGDVIADSQLEATAAADFGGSKVAFMNPGGIRVDLLDDGSVTYNDLYSIQPFANTLVVKTMTGQQIKDLLEQQFDNAKPGEDKILQVSNGFTYSYDRSKPAGSRVDASSIAIAGVPVAATDSVRVTMNNFLATGGDGFTVFNQGTDQLGGPVDIDVFADYFTKHSPVAPGPRNRITRTG